MSKGVGARQDKGKDNIRDRESEADQDKERSRDRATKKTLEEDDDFKANIHDKRDEDVDKQGKASNLDGGEQNGEISAHPSETELGERILKMKEARLSKQSEGAAEILSWVSRRKRMLKRKCEELRTRPSQKEVLEKEKSLLEDDVNKFHKMIEEFTVRIKEVERVLSDKEKQLEAKVQENKNICEENEELKKRVELQTFNARDMERMRKELQAVERDIAEAELARNAWEEKSWDLETSLGHKVNDLEALVLDCNQALRRLILLILSYTFIF